MFQFNEEGEKDILQFASRQLRKPEKNYAVVEIEALAIIFAVTKWKIYLMGRPFCIRSDHHALSFLKLSVPPNSRLIRFALYLQQFQFEVEYIKGEENFLADYLSRFPASQSSNLENVGESIQVFKVNVQKEFISILNNFEKFQKKDITIKILMDSLINNPGKHSTYQIFNNLLFRKDNNKYQLYVPESLVEIILKAFHDDFGHFGIKRTVNLIEEKFYFPNMRRKVKKYVASCENCQKSKWNNRQLSLDYRPITANEVDELLSIDLFGPLPKSRGGVQYVLVTYDVFSKLVRLYALKKATTQAILKSLEKYLETVGKPKRTLSDNGSQFTSKTFKNKMSEWGIKISYTSVRHPASNPVERMMKELGRLCRAYCHEAHKSWAIHLTTFQLWINSATNFVTNVPPNLIHFGEEKSIVHQLINFPQQTLPTVHEIREGVKIQTQKIAKLRKRKSLPGSQETPPDFEVNDLVLIKKDAYSSAEKGEIKKFHMLYEGPFKVAKTIHKDTFLLKNLNSGKDRGIFNRTLLKKFVSRE
jgi:hypothetical protein